MTNQHRFFPRPRLWGLRWGLLCGLTLAVAQFFTGAGIASYRRRRLPALTLLWVLVLTLGLVQPTQAQSVTTAVVVTWGSNTYGQLNIPAGLSSVTAIAAGKFHSLALKSNGTVVAWGDNGSGQLNMPAGLSGVTAITGGGFHSLALKSDGTVVAWGSNSSGQSTVPGGLSGVIAIAGGGHHSLALKSDGTVVAWGCSGIVLYNQGQCNVPTGLNNVTAIAGGNLHSLARKSDGSVVGWGRNNEGQLNIPAGLSGVVAIAAGEDFSLALKNDGTVVGWGQIGIPAGLSSVSAIAAGSFHALARKNDGTVVGWGYNGLGQTTIPVGLTGVAAIAGGSTHSLALQVTDESIPPTAHPQQSPAANAAGWNNTIVTVTWNWTDAESGINPPYCDTSTTSQGEGPQTITGLCIDQVGNFTEASYTVKVDRAAPQVRATINGTAGGQAWYNQAVTVSFTCQEQGTGSGLATNTVGGNVTMSSEGDHPAVTSTGVCTDNAGNAATPVTVGPFKLDLTKPTISAAATTQPNANGWYKSDVTVHFTCADALSGITICPDDQILSSEGTAVSSTARTFLDKALNASDPSNVVTVKIDKTAPSVLVTGVANGAVYDFGSVPTATCSTSDALSGVATQATVSISGGNPDGSGAFTATCSGATDLADNSAAGVSVNYTVNPPADSTAPVITPQIVGTLGTNGWYVSDVTVSWSVVDAESAISSQSGCDPVTVNADTAGDTFTCSATSTGGSNSQSVTIKRDVTAPTISAAASSGPNGNGWYNSHVTVQFTCNDTLSGVVSCPADETLSSEGSAVASTAQTITDQAGNSSAASNVVTVQLDKTAPIVTVTGVSNGANYTLGSVPAAGCSTTDALSGVATQATASVTGGNPDGTGSFTATCSGATDNAGNSGSASVSYTVTAVVSDACTTTALRDNFNRANGSLGSQWAGLTGQSFYKIAGNRVDVQLGGPVLWKPTTFGVNQAAFVTLSTLDANSPSQGVLLKVQGGTIPNAGAIAVVYDSLAKAVRVSTLRLNTPAWTVYGHTPATFANGDKLLGCVQANGTVRVYRNNTLLTTVTLNAADQSFFNAKGGKIGLWTVAASNAFVDDFGGGALTGVTGATLDATVPAEVADDGAAITVAVDFPTDDTAGAPNAGALVNQLFLPLVTR